ncbi:Kelch repeat-containing protein 3 [Neolecta irregularis DAH-3]|uniref:Kelch repeat-containing protein 3 n=1 Tax=Neolecta irregularis (strain DAH-3) TaxID=1198029 RepID=A0A1U7LIZ0_NEOID|nr:Kelch repeat-containing protein 3 [Neolecta irregularis DAH-3]|eukprot:OLL22614.1 Kelch repeat-containing protein 3 [Neolecta irregularis DAH-3]
MGKDKKTAKAEKKARTAEKTQRKESKKTAKTKKKSKFADHDVDIDVVLQDYARQQEKFNEITEIVHDGPPSRRVNATLVNNPFKNELLLFGGELYDGKTATFYNGSYNIDKSEWRKITSGNSPLPRSAHQLVSHSSGILFLFGGEFSSPKQKTFYHYSDFWSLDPTTRTWTRITTSKKNPSPSARSGHRMVSWKNFIILFGGFQDTGAHTNYLDDLWVFDVHEYTWTKIEFAPHTQRPEARSGFSLLPAADGAVLIGGYSRMKEGKNSRGIVHTDIWLLRMSSTLKNIRWEKRRKPGFAPSPRVGYQMVYHRGRGLAFGGVYDSLDEEENLESTFFNDLYAYQTEMHRWYGLQLRPPRQRTRKIVEHRRQRGKVADDELLQLQKAIEQSTGLDDDDLTVDVSQGNTLHEEIKLSMELPHERFNTMLAVSNDVLYIYGGSFESSREYTLDSFHAIDLVKLDGVRTIWETPIEEERWEGSASETESEDDEEDDEEEDEEEEALESGHVLSETRKDSKSTRVDDPGSNEPVSTIDPSLPIPKPFESLKEFYDRTAAAWLEVAMEKSRSRGKELRKDGFIRAEMHWWDCREEVRALEDKMDEEGDLGMGEVVEKDIKTSQMGKRR